MNDVDAKASRRISLWSEQSESSRPHRSLSTLTWYREHETQQPGINFIGIKFNKSSGKRIPLLSNTKKKKKTII